MLRVAPAWLSGYAGRILLLVLLVNFGMQTARYAYGLTLPAMRDTLSLSYSQAGGLITALSSFNMVTSLVVGILVPRYGSRFIVGAGTILLGVAMVLLGISSNFLMALAMSALIGVASGAATVPAMSLLSVWFESRTRGTVAGLAAAGGGVGFIITGALVPWLTDRDLEDGWRHTWYFLASIVIVTGVLCLLYLRDRPRRVARPPERPAAWLMAIWSNPRVWLISFLALCSGWCIGLYTTFFGVYLVEQDVSLAVSGRLWILLGILAVGSGVIWGTVSDRFGRRAGFLFSFATLGVGLAIFWVWPVMAGFILSVIFAGVSLRATYTVCAASAGDYVAPHFSAAAFGLMGMGAGLGNGVGPLIGGRIADATGELSWVFVLATGGAAAGIVVSNFLGRPPAPAPD